MMDKPSEAVVATFTEMKRCFDLQGFSFEFGKGWNEECVGQTHATQSGCYIQVRHTEVLDYEISLEQTNLGDATATPDQRARAAIHMQIKTALIYNRRSQNSQYFLRHFQPHLDAAGIDKVVASLVALHTEYDKMWFELESKKVQKKLTNLIKAYEADRARIVGSISAVLNQLFPAPEKVKV